MQMTDSPQTERWGNVKRMFALIIGINSYSHVPKLKGAVADADRFKSFLLNQVKVQEDRIITLRDPEKTRRDGIVDAFRHLWECESIQRNDPILIFYAGHGCEMSPPEHLGPGQQKNIQAICPSDMDPKDPTSRAKCPIPDLTIAIWLNLLSYKKGHNITVILDCCHSAGATRDPEEGTRALPFYGKFPPTLEEECVEARKIAGGVPLSYLHQHSRSHVLLAACSAKETAKEDMDGTGGFFTTELLRALKEEHNVDQMSFLEFTGRLGELTEENKILQTPQCYGHFKDRILFSNLLKLGSEIFPVSRDDETKYRIEAGLVHGIDEGSLFDGYETATVDTTVKKPHCTLTAQSVHPLYTIAAINEPNVQLPEVDGVVRQVRSGNPLKVHFTSAFLTVLCQDEVLNLHDLRRKVKVEDSAASANFIIDTEGEKVVFSTNLKAMTDHEFTRLPKPVPTNSERVCCVLLAASRWKRHLEISCDSPLAENIQIEFFRLQTSVDHTGFVFKPKDENLTHGNDVVRVDVKRNHNDYYGMKITNNTPEHLYFSKFHFSMLAFDIGDLDITSSVSGSIGVQSTGIQSKGDADPALPSMESLLIGFGNDGETPLKFQYPPGQVNVTVLKMYFTTIPMDMKWMEQGTPFTDPKVKRGGLSEGEEVRRELIASNPLIFTKSFTIVQRRARA